MKEISKWKALAPQIHAHFGLSEAARKVALEDARSHPLKALRSYEAIAASLTCKPVEAHRPSRRRP